MNKPLIYTAAASLVVIAASAAILPAVGAVNPAPAIAFGGLTTIYVAAGAYDSSNPAILERQPRSSAATSAASPQTSVS